MMNVSSMDEWLNPELDWDLDLRGGGGLLDAAAMRSVFEPAGFCHPGERSEPLPNLPTISTTSSDAESLDEHHFITPSSGDELTYSDESEASVSTEPLDEKTLLQRLEKQSSKPSVVRRHKSRSSTYKRKDSDRPKRNLSAYNIFFRRMRPKIIQETHRKISFAELGKLIGQRWRSLTPSERDEFDQLAEKDFHRYRQEMDVWKRGRRRKFGETSPRLDSKSPRPSSPSTIPTYITSVAGFQQQPPPEMPLSSSFADSDRHVRRVSCDLPPEPPQVLSQVPSANLQRPSLVQRKPSLVSSGYDPPKEQASSSRAAFIQENSGPRQVDPSLYYPFHPPRGPTPLHYKSYPPTTASAPRKGTRTMYTSAGAPTPIPPPKSAGPVRYACFRMTRAEAEVYMRRNPQAMAKI